MSITLKESNAWIPTRGFNWLFKVRKLFAEHPAPIRTGLHFENAACQDLGAVLSALSSVAGDDYELKTKFFDSKLFQSNLEFLNPELKVDT